MWPRSHRRWMTKFAPGVDGDDAPMAVDVMPTDNVVPLKPAARKQRSAPKAVKPKPAPVAQDDLPLRAHPGPETQTGPGARTCCPGTRGRGNRRLRRPTLIALRNRLAALVATAAPGPDAAPSECIPYDPVSRLHPAA